MHIITSEMLKDDPIFALVYGASGTGKTHLMGTVAELGKTLLIDIDQGCKTLFTAKDIVNAKWSDNLYVTSFEKFGDLDAAYKLVDANDPTKWTKALGEEITEPFEWVIWDTWSEIQWFMMEELRSKSSELKVPVGKTIDFRKNVGIQHWGSMTDLNKLAVETLRTCKVNQILTMQEKLDKDELTGTVYGGPAIHGKLVQEMPAYFDIVVHTLTDVQGNYCATTKSKGRWPGKTRLGEPGEFKNPTGKVLFKK